jgi:FixJ family two-component response regulator
MDAMFTVFIVDDDASVIKALSRLMRLKGYDAKPYTSPQEFLTHHDSKLPGCAIFDVSMPGLDGLELQQALAAAGSHRPVIFITGKGDVPTSVRAMKAGAIDFLTPRAEELDSKARQAQADLALIDEKIATLTPREREVLRHVVAGKLNKQIAYELGTVEKTIKFHRGAIMKKLGVRRPSPCWCHSAVIGLRSTQR